MISVLLIIIYRGSSVSCDNNWGVLGVFTEIRIDLEEKRGNQEDYLPIIIIYYDRCLLVVGRCKSNLLWICYVLCVLPDLCSVSWHKKGMCLIGTLIGTLFIVLYLYLILPIIFFFFFKGLNIYCRKLLSILL